MTASGLYLSDCVEALQRYASCIHESMPVEHIGYPAIKLMIYCIMWPNEAMSPTDVALLSSTVKAACWNVESITFTR